MRPILLLCTLVLLSVGMADAQEHRYTQGVLTDNTTIVTSEETQMVRVRVPRERTHRERPDSISKKWELGIRAGSLPAVQVAALYQYNYNRYIEARIGASFCGYIPVMVDATILHNWRFDLSNSNRGKWFLDTGIGCSVGGWRKGGGEWSSVDVIAGPTGNVRIGYQFNNSPFSIAFDWSPTIGFYRLIYKEFSATVFYGKGLMNFGLSCAVRF